MYINLELKLKIKIKLKSKKVDWKILKDIARGIKDILDGKVKEI